MISYSTIPVFSWCVHVDKLKFNTMLATLAILAMLYPSTMFSLIHNIDAHCQNSLGCHLPPTCLLHQKVCFGPIGVYLTSKEDNLSLSLSHSLQD